MATSLLEQGCAVDFVGSDDLEAPDLSGNPLFRFLNLRGSQRPDAGPLAKVGRVVAYYARLLHYAVTAEPRLFHVLWNNKLEMFDRTALMAFYWLMGRKVVLTVHNVNAGKRDGTDWWLNRFTLRTQYRLAHHLFVHTGQMASALNSEFGVELEKVTVIPFGLNDSVPSTGLTRAAARERLALAADDRVVLFYGNIAPYKGVDLLVRAAALVVGRIPTFRLVIAGRAAGARSYLESIERLIRELKLQRHVVSRVEFVPDAETEWYFKAADVLALPYTFVFQSGVMFLSYNFGLPVIAADVGSLRDDVIDGVTGYVCVPGNPDDLASKIIRYFSSSLYADLEANRPRIRQMVAERHSWAAVGTSTMAVYTQLLAARTGLRTPSVHSSAGPGGTA